MAKDIGKLKAIELDFDDLEYEDIEKSQLKYLNDKVIALTRDGNPYIDIRFTYNPHSCYHADGKFFYLEIKPHGCYLRLAGYGSPYISIGEISMLTANDLRNALNIFMVKDIIEE